MPITKNELTQIKGAVRDEIRGAIKDLATREEVHSEVENLARIVAKGFEQVNKQFETVDKRLSHLEMEASHTNARLSVIERDVAEIRKARVAYLEKKAGVKSGK